MIRTATASISLSYWQQFGIFTLLSITGIACGLLISACVASPDRATALTPYILIPQIILGGSFIPIEDITMVVLASLSAPVLLGIPGASPWHHPAANLFRLPRLPKKTESSLLVSYLALSVQLTILMGAAAWFLRRKDIGKA